MKRFWSLLITLALACGIYAPASASNTADEAAKLASGIIAYNVRASGCTDERQWISHSLLTQRSPGFEWYVMMLKQFGRGIDDGDFQAAIEEQIASSGVLGASTRLKYALALSACGQKENKYVLDAAQEAPGTQGIMSLIYGLHLLNNGVSSDAHSADSLIDQILALRKSDGGWAVMGNRSDVDVTAMTLQALSPYAGRNPQLDAVLPQALESLRRAQTEDGDFVGFGGVRSLETTAQVVIALCALGRDPQMNSIFINENGKSPLDGMQLYALEDGSYSHLIQDKTNPTATLQAFEAYVALWRLREGKSYLYCFDAPQSGEVIGAEKQSKAPDPKRIIILGIAAAGIIACIVLLLLKKKNIKNYLFVFAACGVMIAIIAITNISTAGDYYSGDGQTSLEIVGTVRMTIRCDTVKDRLDSKYIPESGVILPLKAFDLGKGETAFDLLTRAARANKIQVENRGSSFGAHGLAYIAGINYLYEFDYGDLSGWIYHVNGMPPSVNSGEYELKDGDLVEWLYTCDLGEDVRYFNVLDLTEDEANE